MEDRQEDRPPGSVTDLREARARRAADRIAERYRGRDSSRLQDFVEEQGMGEMIERVRQAIRDSELSYYELEQRTGVPARNLSRFVRGERGMNLETLERIAGEIGVRLVVRRRRS